MCIIQLSTKQRNINLINNITTSNDIIHCLLLDTNNCNQCHHLLRLAVMDLRLLRLRASQKRQEWGTVSRKCFKGITNLLFCNLLFCNHFHSSQATSNILAYEQIKILEQLIDNDSLVVAETLLVSLKNKPTKRYSLRIVELRDEATLHAIVRSYLPRSHH